MARVLSVAYDPTLLHTRDHLLRRAGHDAESVLGFNAAMEACRRPFDLVLLGVSIPAKDKVQIIGCYRDANPRGFVLCFTRPGVRRVKEADGYVNPGDPEALLRAIEYFLAPRPSKRRTTAQGRTD